MTKPRLFWAFLSCASIVLSTCVRPGEDRASEDLEVGHSEIAGIALEVADGLAAIRSLSTSEALLWAQAPVLHLNIASTQARSLRLEIRNCMPDAVLAVRGNLLQAIEKPRATWCVFTVELETGQNRLTLAPPDWETTESYKFADMGDIQEAMGSVDEVFRAISAVPDLRFVMSTGDVVQKGELWEYELFQEQLEDLDIPFYSTVGNHELTQDARRWHDRFGLYSVHFSFKGVDFSYVDSGNAGLDSALYDRLDTWLEEGKERIHIFGTHYPPKDPVGFRNAGFRSRNEASKLLAKLAAGAVDLTLYGHVHSYYQFENAGIPAYISGGGGALPERLDGIDRHFLVIDVDPLDNQIRSVEVSRVD